MDSPRASETPAAVRASRRWLATGLVFAGGALSGCGEVCLASGEPERLTLLAVEVGAGGEPDLFGATSPEEAAEFVERWEIPVDVPDEDDFGDQLIYFTTTITPDGHMEWITGVLSDGPDRLVVRIDSDYPCEDGDDTGAGDSVLAVYKVWHGGELSACRSGVRCNGPPKTTDRAVVPPIEQRRPTGVTDGDLGSEHPPGFMRLRPREIAEDGGR